MASVENQVERVAEVPMNLRTWFVRALNTLNNQFFLSVVANTALFIAFTGGTILIPSNIEWLMWGDSATHYLGWEFFRRGPLTVWPLGESPLYGAGYSSSVVYSDSIPLFAIPLKFVLRGFSGQFQYLGFWIYCCFVGQGVAAIKLLRSLSVQNCYVLPLSLMFSLMPGFLYRMVTGGYGHMALVGHFLVLLALGMVLRPYETRSWLILLIFALLVHAYLFLLVTAIYFSGFLRFVVKRERSESWNWIAAPLKSITWIFIWVGLAAYASGYFKTAEWSDDGFGVFRADLLTFFDPNTVDFFGWSRLAEDIPWTDGSHEGYAFLGVGVLLLLVIGARLLGKGVKQSSALLPVACGLFVVSLSNRIMADGEELLVIPIPDAIAPAFGAIRSSGRLAWPLMYVVLCIAIVAVTSAKLPKIAALFLIFSALGIQVFDSMPAYREIRERFVESSRDPSVLPSPQWDELAQDKSCLYTVPTQFKGQNWISFAELALRHEMSTNASYLVRFEAEKIQRQSEDLSRNLSDGELSSDCLYVVVHDQPAELADWLRERYKTVEDKNQRNVYLIDNFVAVTIN